jgi:hypothetical protein
MDTLIERHPIDFFGIGVAIAGLFATFYIALFADSFPCFSGFSGYMGIPFSTVARVSISSLTYLQTCYFAVADAVLAST